MNRTILTLLLTAAAVVSPALTQTPRPDPQTSAPTAAAVTVDQIIDKYLRAIGGEAAYDKISTRVRKGSVEVTGVPGQGTVEEYQKAPDKIVSKMTLPVLGVVLYGYDGKNGWKYDATNGLADMSGKELESVVLDARLDADVKLRQRFARMELKGLHKVNGRDAYVIVGTPVGQKPEKFYFDTQSGLLVRVDATRATEAGDSSVEVYMDDYREVEGVKIPFAERLKSMGLTFTFKYATVQVNLPLDDAMFRKPVRK